MYSIGLDARRAAASDRTDVERISVCRGVGDAAVVGQREEEAVHRCALVLLLRAWSCFWSYAPPPRLRLRAPAHRYRQSSNRRTYQAIGAAPGARVPDAFPTFGHTASGV